jgi:dihydrofolate synthase/folylpolyglutamate synthase
VTFEELKAVLFARGNFGMKLGLDRMREALSLLGDPHLAYRTLHVAGTNGKGSTCAFAEASLRAAGLRTGLYTSPHLRHFCERIRLDFAPIGEPDAAALLEEIVARVPWALGDPGLTFFEIVTLMGFLAFAHARVDVAVIEVGLGGRLDATNLVAPRACAVTALGLEHTQYLGSTLAAIAREKGGIFKPGVPAVTAGQPLAAARELSKLSKAIWRPGRDYRFESRPDQPFCYAGPGWTVRAEPGLEGLHQRANAALACALLEAAALPEVTPRHAEQGLAAARWPGRLERLGDHPAVLLDGAHNPHAAAALARALRGRQVVLVFAAMQDKDAAAMLRELAPIVREVHFCAAGSVRARPASELASLWPGTAHESPAAALEAARRSAGPDGTVLCCGSLYLVGELEGLLAGEATPRMPSERL